MLSYWWKLSKYHFFAKEIQYLVHILSTIGIRPLPLNIQAINTIHPLKTAKQVLAFLGLIGYYRKIIKNFAKIARLLSLLTHHKAKFKWTSAHHPAFLILKEAIIQAPILHYPDPAKKYIIYADASDSLCWAQLSQEHDGNKFLVIFLSHTFTETQRKWCTPEQEAYGVYYAITKWNHYLLGSDIIVCNDHKPLAKFQNGKNNNKVNRWWLELATYNITFEWISGAKYKAADFPFRLDKLPNNTEATFMMLTATSSDRPAFNTQSQTSQWYQTTKDTSNTPSISNPATSVFTTVETAWDITPKPLTAKRHEALLQMQRTDSFCKHISKRLSNGKAPQHEADLFMHVKGLLYKHIMDANQKFLALIIPKAWQYTVLVEAHDKLRHQGVTCTHCLIKYQYYWEGMNKDIQKYIANCMLHWQEKAKVQSYPL